MRQSTVRLPATAIRLADLTFPSERVQIHRTRLAFIHLDNLLHFSKIDRDGRVDGYVAAYLPDAVALLFLRRGEVVTAARVTDHGREVAPIAAVLRDIREEVERGELSFCDAPLEQLAWMYQSCAAPASLRFADLRQPEHLFPLLQQERYTGVLELIAGGNVSYLRFEGGRFSRGYYTGKPESVTVAQHIESLFRGPADGEATPLMGSVFPVVTDLPDQAPSSLLQSYRELYWRVVEVAEREVPGQVVARAAKARDALVSAHPVLDALSRPLDTPPVELVTTASDVTRALASWCRDLLQSLEIVAPGVAPTIVKEATREQRFVLQKAGFYQQVPWTVSW
ncbi:MAG TPA: hypothetical protein VF970_07220 [Gemmatimonadales bacterium]